jgi:ribosomal protein S18 acetylase RimI-like enzyme
MSTTDRQPGCGSQSVDGGGPSQSLPLVADNTEWMSIIYKWRGDFDNVEVNLLHAEAFETRDTVARDWRSALTDYALGWVTARDGARLVGFVNVIWDGLVHAWIQDTTVARNVRSQGIGTQLVLMAREEAKEAGCEWLHVDFDGPLGNFYYRACGFAYTSAGLISLR